MHVLLPATSSIPARVAADALVAAGHVVHRCHEPGDTGFACTALLGRRCPLEAEPVDVVVDVRAVPSSRPTPQEDGVLCATRRRIPVVVAGATAHQPFGPLTAAVAETAEVVGTVERVAASPLPEHSRLATVALLDVLDRAGPRVERARAEARRSDGRLRVVIDVDPPLSRPVADAAAVAVARELRSLDPWARGLDIRMTGDLEQHRTRRSLDHILDDLHGTVGADRNAPPS